MPRSSGGGSHRSGGSRSHSSGGGSHRSGSHRSSSHSGGGSSSHRSNSYFAGSTRYVYYRDKKPVIFYANYDPTKRSYPWPVVCFFALCYILALIALIDFPPAKLSADYDTRIVISDGADVIEDEAKLEASLRAFYEKTGITPAVMTVHNEDWNDRYSSVEPYAYKLYAYNFSDGKHWLIVYSQPEKPKSEFNDRRWKGIQGDDTVDILTESVCDDFNAKLKRYLLADKFYTVEEAIETAFDELTPTVRKIKVEVGLVICIVIQGLFLVILFRALAGNPHELKAVVCPENAKEVVCGYCGGIYVTGTCTTCPHCNAPLKVDNPYNQETDDFGYGTSAGSVNLNGEDIKL